MGQSPSSAPPPSGQPHRGRNWTGTHEHPTAAPSAEAPRHPPGPGDQLYCTQPPNLTRGRAADRKPRRTPPTARASEPLRSRPVAPPTRPDARHPAGRCRPQTTAQGENHRASAHWLTEGTVGEQRPARRGANRMVLGVDAADLDWHGEEQSATPGEHEGQLLSLPPARDKRAGRGREDDPDGEEGPLRAPGRDPRAGRDERAEKSEAARTQSDGRGAAGTRESGAVGRERGSGWAWSQTDRRHGGVAQDKQVKKSDVVSPRWRNRAEPRRGGGGGRAPVTQTSPSAKSCPLSLEGAAVGPPEALPTPRPQPKPKLTPYLTLVLWANHTLPLGPFSPGQGNHPRARW